MTKDKNQKNFTFTGIGRRFRFRPISKPGFKDIIESFDPDITQIAEGQFKNDLLHGFGRKFYLNGKVEIGWFKDGKIDGYCFQRE